MEQSPECESDRPVSVHARSGPGVSPSGRRQRGLLRRGEDSLHQFRPRGHPLGGACQLLREQRRGDDDDEEISSDDEIVKGDDDVDDDMKEDEDDEAEDNEEGEDEEGSDESNEEFVDEEEKSASRKRKLKLSEYPAILSKRHKSFEKYRYALYCTGTILCRQWYVRK